MFVAAWRPVVWYTIRVQHLVFRLPPDSWFWIQLTSIALGTTLRVGDLVTETVCDSVCDKFKLVGLVGLLLNFTGPG